MSPAPADYVDVAERIRGFKAQYPDGSLQSHALPFILEAGDKQFIVYCAAAYRSPDDPRPGIGWAWEPVPGPTPFTRDSELMNAETSAWGRAIVALGFETKKIASANEVRNRQQDTPETPQEPFRAPASAGAEDSPMLPGQKTEIKGLLEALEKEMPSSLRMMDWTTEAANWSKEQFNLPEGQQLNRAQAQRLVMELERWLVEEQAARAGAKA